MFGRTRDELGERSSDTTQSTLTGHRSEFQVVNVLQKIGDLQSFSVLFFMKRRLQE